MIPKNHSMFAVIPAAILFDERLTPTEKLLFAVISSLARADGYCRASNGYIGRSLNLKERQTRALIDKLEKCGFIERVLDPKDVRKLWITEQGGGSRMPGVHIVNVKDKKNIAAVEKFDAALAVEKLKASPQRHIQIIGHFIEEKSLALADADQLKITLRRHLRDAVTLAKFSDRQIAEATELAENEYRDKWTLGTLVKILTRQKI